MAGFGAIHTQTVSRIVFWELNLLNLRINNRIIFSLDNHRVFSNRKETLHGRLAVHAVIGVRCVLHLTF